MDEISQQNTLTRRDGVRIFGWELLQNAPVIAALGVALRYRASGLSQSLLVGVIGAALSALVITATEKYKLKLETRPFNVKELLSNTLIFSGFVAIYLFYASSGGYRLDTLIGLTLGLLGGAAQWLLLKQSMSDGLRHTVALAAIGPIVLVLIRYSSELSIIYAAFILFGAAFIMTFIIALIDYYLPMSAAMD